jgi:hypothetical protein
VELKATRELTPRKTKYAHQRRLERVSANADIERWCRVWHFLLVYHYQGKLVRRVDLKRLVGGSEDKINSALNGLSSRDLPIYEEECGRALLLGILTPLSVEEVRERLTQYSSSGMEGCI